MSNPFPKGVLFVPLPSAVVEIFGEMTEAEVRLYCALLLFAQKRTAVHLHLPVYLLHDYTKLHGETIGIARRKLVSRGLIACSKGHSGVTVYTLLHPVTGAELPAPVHGKQKFSGVYIHKSADRSSRQAREAAKAEAVEVPPTPPIPPTIPPIWDDIGSSQSGNPEQSRPSQSVRMSNPIREQVADSLVSGFAQTLENANVSKNQTPISKKTLKKEILNEESSEQIRKVKVVGKERVLIDPPVPRWLNESVVLRMMEKFGAKVRTVVDYKEQAD